MEMVTPEDSGTRAGQTRRGRGQKLEYDEAGE